MFIKSTAPVASCLPNIHVTTFFTFNLVHHTFPPASTVATATCVGLAHTTFTWGGSFNFCLFDVFEYGGAAFFHDLDVDAFTLYDIFISAFQF